jgi:hypothetical protein
MNAASNNDLEHERNIHHIGKVEMVRKEVHNVSFKRKRTYSENYQIIQNMKGRTLELRNLIEKEESSSNSQKKQLSNVKIFMVNSLKQILNDTHRAQKSHRILHASIAKLGKSIDKHFEPDLFLFKPSNNMTTQEMLRIRKDINHSVTTHIAIVGANVDGPETVMNKYNKDSESTNNNNKKKNNSSGIEKKKSNKNIIAINLFEKEMVDNNGSSKNNNGSASEKEKQVTKKSLTKSCDDNNKNNSSSVNFHPIHSLYMELNSIVSDLLSGKTEGAITWTMSNINSDDEILDLEFQLRTLHYISLLRQSDMDGAVRYSQAYFPKFVGKHGEAIQSLMGCLLFPGANTSNLKYAQMQSDETWQKIIQSFKKCYCKQHRLPLYSALATAVNVGVDAMEDVRKLDGILEMKNKNSNSSSSSSKISNVDNSINTHESWHELPELPVNIEVRQNAQFHSIFTCPVSKDQASKQNPPVLLTCGHALCKESMLLIARGRSRFKCPYCPQEILSRDIIELTI